MLLSKFVCELRCEAGEMVCRLVSDVLQRRGCLKRVRSIIEPHPALFPTVGAKMGHTQKSGHTVLKFLFSIKVTSRM